MQSAPHPLAIVAALFSISTVARADSWEDAVVQCAPALRTMRV